MVSHPHGEYSSRESHLGRLAGMPHKALILIRTVCYTTEKMLSVLKLYIYLIRWFLYNMRGYFASYVVFFRAPKGRGKIRAMSKMSGSIICKTIE